MAKTAEGKLALVTMVYHDGDVKLRFADGETSGYIKPDSLAQATPSDAGYEALLPLALGLQLCEAAEAGDAAAIERLAGEGASPDAKNERGRPAVYRAAVYGHTAAVEALLRLGADPDATTSNGWTALVAAAFYGQAECARLLLEAGADASLRPTGGRWEGKTALEVAAGHGHAQHGHGGLGGDHAGQVGSTASPCDDGLQASACSGFGVGKHVVGHAVGRDHAGLVRDAELLKDLHCVLHGVPVAAGTHDDADLDGFHGVWGWRCGCAEQPLAMDGTRDFTFCVPPRHIRSQAWAKIARTCL